MSTWGTFDIETIPLPNLPEELRPKFDEASVKLGQLKDRFKIAEKIEEARAKHAADLDKTMSLDPDLVMLTGVALGAIAEVAYAMARKYGWTR